MPLIKYFGFVGSALVLLLIGSGWCFPRPPSGPPEPHGVTDRPAIRIASAERLPEQVIIDTSLPTIVPPPNVLEFAERWPQATVADVNPIPKPAPMSDLGGKADVVRPPIDVAFGPKSQLWRFAQNKDEIAERYATDAEYRASLIVTKYADR
jgi:hypothetical protein